MGLEYLPTLKTITLSQLRRKILRFHITETTPANDHCLIAIYDIYNISQRTMREPKTASTSLVKGGFGVDWFGLAVWNSGVFHQAARS